MNHSQASSVWNHELFKTKAIHGISSEQSHNRVRNQIDGVCAGTLLRTLRDAGCVQVIGQYLLNGEGCSARSGTTLSHWPSCYGSHVRTALHAKVAHKPVNSSLCMPMEPSLVRDAYGWPSVKTSNEAVYQGALLLIHREESPSSSTHLQTAYIQQPTVV